MVKLQCTAFAAAIRSFKTQATCRFEIKLFGSPLIQYVSYLPLARGRRGPWVGPAGLGVGGINNSFDQGAEAAIVILFLCKQEAGSLIA